MSTKQKKEKIPCEGCKKAFYKSQLCDVEELNIKNQCVICIYITPDEEEFDQYLRQQTRGF